MRRSDAAGFDARDIVGVIGLHSGGVRPARQANARGADVLDVHAEEILRPFLKGHRESRLKLG
eukprot:scaffold6382_cov110-Isochrysis_galbana.AAC.1